MANSEDKISCKSGRLKIIDPNKIHSNDSFSNIPVNNEDLTISVILSTYKKGRTILTATNNTTGTFNTQGDISINFIDGSNVNGKKVLTTNYTDLTTIFDDNATNNAGESLGITSIDIDFNSQQAPLITINFIDVRGSAIFQNEANITGGKNKYSTFFQLPYPLFRLTIKGYYGLPVEYCLHMTKFNSKFNSQTGNFEITANFIGFTYAMMSDMLIGYLKAIPFTTIGGQKYQDINNVRNLDGLGKIMTLTDLMIAISNINGDVKKLAADDVNAIEITNTKDKISKLNDIKDAITGLGSQLDIRQTNLPLNFNYIIKPSVHETKANTYIADYKTNIDKLLTDFNTNSNIQINTTFFDISYGSYSYLGETTVDGLNEIIKNTQNSSSTVGYQIIEYIHNVDNNLTGVMTDTTKFESWNLTYAFAEINRIRPLLEESQKIAEKNLGEAVRKNIKTKLGLDPTIRNIIEIFTTAVEVFMESIYQVSSEAEQDSSGLRNIQINKKFQNQKSVDIKNVKDTDKHILSWPGYREAKTVDNKESYVEKYLGSLKPTPILEKPSDVNEIAFIEDLLNGFIKAEQQTENAINITNQAENSWFPVNPADSKLFVPTTPYARIGKNGFSSEKEIVNLMLIRAMTFLGYNDLLDITEIQEMAEIDTMTMINTIEDTNIKHTIFNNYKTPDNFFQLRGDAITKNQSPDGKFFIDDKYKYDYIGYAPPTNQVEGQIILPISDGFSGIWDYNTQDEKHYVNSGTDTIFLSNYKNSVEKKTLKMDNGETFIYYINNYKNTDDGAIYLKEIKSSEFNNTPNLDTSVKPANVKIDDNYIILEKIKKILTTPKQVIDANFNPFGGIHGMQEFVNMDWGDDTLKDLKLRNLFYKEESLIGLALIKGSTTSYDLINFNKGLSPYYDYGGITLNWWDPTKIRDKAFQNKFDKIGSNWSIMANLDLKTTSYPFVDATYSDAIYNIDESPLYIGKSNFNYSLFGSRFYYAQSTSDFPLYSKALLFLSTLPWNGMPFEKPEIKQLFNIRNGFIHVPRLWAAYVGGLIWRRDAGDVKLDSDGLINDANSGAGASDPLKFAKGDKNKNVVDIYHPYRRGYLGINDYQKPLINKDISKMLVYATSIDDYTDLPYVLFALPYNVRNVFKNIFFNFVHKNSTIQGDNSESDLDFNTLNDMLQIVSDGKLETFDKKWGEIQKHIEDENEAQEIDGINYIKTTSITGNLHNVDKYQWMVPLIGDENFKNSDGKDFGQINLMLNGYANDLTSPVGMIVAMMNEEVILANTGFQIWKDPVISKEQYAPVKTNKTNFDAYFNTAIKIINDKWFTNAINADIAKAEIEIFGTSDTDAIKFQLYKTCKNINDKWLAGVDNANNIIFQCGGVTNTVDTGLQKKYRPNDTKTRLIDSFRFVDRAFNDIGKLFYMNPVPVNDYLMNTPNTSIFDAISQLLASNHFTFIPLPTFINYNDPDTLASMFDTYPNYNEIKNAVCGPSFVSVYAGESSKHLDFSESEYPNDGVDFQCVGPSGKDILDVPSDFVGSSNDYENDVAVFSVNYSQQNQNIFKDITLDQSEFGETDESLKITDSITHTASENNISLGGQNIYSVYSVRSYKAEVEMMGNAMIQPMMHFQLNNIPMFHGAYLITRVKHSIKPNHMLTTFNGVRVRYPKTELLSGSDFYMGMLDSMELSANASNATGTVGSKSVPPIIGTIDENGGIPSNIEAGYITMTAIPAIPGIRSQISSSTSKNRLISEAIKPLEEMLKAWVDWMKNEAGFSGFKYPNDNNTYYAQITSAFRSPEDQANSGANKAPGVSYHQYGIAIDFKMADKKGNLIPTEQNLKWFKIANNPALEWLLANSWKYGFASPFGIRDGKGKYNEYWHYEYHGTAAKCIMETNPLTVGGYKTTILPRQTQKIDIVKNPKGKDGKPAIYNGCKYVFTKNDQGTVDNGEQIETKLIYEELKKQLGYGDVAIAAIMGNIYQESKFKPTALNSDGGDYGLVQWVNERKTNLLNWLKTNNLDKTSYKDQIQYLKYELNGSWKYTGKNLASNTDIANATKIFYITYESGSLGMSSFTSEQVEKRLTQMNKIDNTYNKRVTYATDISNMIKTKKWYFPKEI
jgi:LAS superfamily LD-carboxypeptidase LdcB